MKKRILAFVLTLAMLLPTTVFASGDTTTNMNPNGAWGSTPNWGGMPTQNYYPQISMLTLDEPTTTPQMSTKGFKLAESADGTISGSKSAYDTGNTTIIDGNDYQIYQIDLHAESIGMQTGASCDFILILDMSYSMSRTVSGGTTTYLHNLKEACKTFVTDIYNMSKYSRVAIVTYGGYVANTGFETYYWTDNTDANGYRARTDDAAAETAFLMVSTNTDGTLSQNQKLIDAINALTVYGEASEGTAPGRAVEKAVKIYDAVRTTDDNDDIPNGTGESYYNCERGVLLFADGVPTPTDAYEITYYPGSGVGEYGVNFTATYNDVQYAFNWSTVLKTAKGTSTNTNIFTNSNFYSGSPQAAPSILTGCGAKVYSLAVNLPTLDLFEGTVHNIANGCTINNFQLEDGTSIRYCYTHGTTVNYADQNYLCGSFDSASNEFFYRFSSHVLTSQHVPFSTMTEVQQRWQNEDKVGGDGQAPLSTWNSRYPDFLCRNQESGYYISCDDVTDVEDAFRTALQIIGTPYYDLVMVDNITKYFEVVTSITNTDGTVTYRKLQVDETITNSNGLVGTLLLNTDGTQYIRWENVDLIPGETEFDFSFQLVPKAEFLGGNFVDTNNGAYLYDKYNMPLVSFENPKVDVPVKNDDVIGTEINARAGISVLESITYAQIVNRFTITVGKNKLDLTKSDYGLPDWIKDYVNIKVEIRDADADTGTLLTSSSNPLTIRQNHVIYATVWVWSKYNSDGTLTSTTSPPEGANTDTGSITLTVYYPTFIFSDVSLYYGQSLSALTHQWGEEMIATKYLKWYTNEEYDDLINPSKPIEYNTTDGSIKDSEINVEQSFNSADNVLTEIPEIYFVADPIDERVAVGNKTGATDSAFYTKYTDQTGQMGKERIAMNVRVYFQNAGDGVGGFDPDHPNPTNAMRNAFFLHVQCSEGCTAHEECKLAKHKSAGNFHREEDGDLVADATLKAEYWLPEFYITPKFCDLTITKTGGVAGETYVFHISKYNETTKQYEPYNSITITGNGSVTITEMPIGTYAVAEDIAWSWRSKPTVSSVYNKDSSSAGMTARDGTGVAHINLNPNDAQDSVTVTFTNTTVLDKWLNGFSTLVTNIFGVGQVTDTTNP